MIHLVQTYDDTRMIARQLREILGLGYSPINEDTIDYLKFYLDREHNITVLSYNELNRLFANNYKALFGKGISICEKSRWIFFDSDVADWLFTLLHEVGHFLLDHFDSSIDALHYSTETCHDVEQICLFETLADEFAGEFLLPVGWILNFMDTHPDHSYSQIVDYFQRMGLHLKVIHRRMLMAKLLYSLNGGDEFGNQENKVWLESPSDTSIRRWISQKKVASRKLLN